MPPYETSDTKAAIISAVIVLNIVFNILVIAVIARFRELREDRTTLFMFSLSMSDLALGCTALPISAAVCSSATPTVQFMNQYLPTVHMFCMWWFGFNSLHSLCWLTVCKMVAILKPFRYEQLFTSGRCYCIIVFNWVVGAILAASKFSIQTHFTTVTCTHTFRSGSTVSPLALAAYAVSIAVPVVVLVYATTRIFIVVVRTHASITAQVHALDGGAGSSGLVTIKAIRTSKNVLIICFAELVLTIPLTVFALSRHLVGNQVTTEYFKFAAFWLFASTSFVNSVLYLIIYRSVRRKTLRLFVNLYQFFCGN